MILILILKMVIKKMCMCGSSTILRNKTLWEDHTILYYFPPQLYCYFNKFSTLILSLLHTIISFSPYAFYFFLFIPAPNNFGFHSFYCFDLRSELNFRESRETTCLCIMNQSLLSIHQKVTLEKYLQYYPLTPYQTF